MSERETGRERQEQGTRIEKVYARGKKFKHDNFLLFINFIEFTLSLMCVII